MSTRLGRDSPGGDAHGRAGDAAAADEALVESVRVLVDRYCRSRLAGYDGGAEAAEHIAHEVCLSAVEQLRRSRDRGAPLAALVFSIASHKVVEAQRRLGREPLDAEDAPPAAGSD